MLPFSPSKSICSKPECSSGSFRLLAVPLMQNAGSFFFASPIAALAFWVSPVAASVVV